MLPDIFGHFLDDWEKLLVFCLTRGVQGPVSGGQLWERGSPGPGASGCRGLRGPGQREVGGGEARSGPGLGGGCARPAPRVILGPPPGPAPAHTGQTGPGRGQQLLLGRGEAGHPASSATQTVPATAENTLVTPDYCQPWLLIRSSHTSRSSPPWSPCWWSPSGWPAAAAAAWRSAGTGRSSSGPTTAAAAPRSARCWRWSGAAGPRSGSACPSWIRGQPLR